MFLLSSTLFLDTQYWLAQPQTWVAVALPALISGVYLARERLNKLDLFLVFAGIMAETLLARLVEVEGTRELHTAPVFACLLAVLVGIRMYIPDIGKAYALTWVVSITSDFFGMMRLTSTVGEPVHLPIGIGGAGVGDALFVVPIVLAVGLAVLSLVRRQSASDTGARQPFNRQAWRLAFSSRTQAPK